MFQISLVSLTTTNMHRHTILQFTVDLWCIKIIHIICLYMYVCEWGVMYCCDLLWECPSWAGACRSQASAAHLWERGGRWKEEGGIGVGRKGERKRQHSENVHTQCKTYLHSMYINLAAASTEYISEFRSRRGEHLAAKFQVAGKYKSKGVNPILKAITKGMGLKGAPLVSLKCIHN